MAALRTGSKCTAHPAPRAGLRFFAASRLALNPNLNFEIGSNIARRSKGLMYAFSKGSQQPGP